MTVRFNGDITAKRIQSLIDEMSRYEYVDLYFSTDGGYITEIQILIDYLNKRNEQQSVKVYLCDFIQSAGAYLLWEYEGPLFIHRSFSYFMFHNPDIVTPVSRKDESHKIGEALLVKSLDEFRANLKLIGLDNKQVQKVKDGGNVFITRDQLSKIKVPLFNSDELLRSFKKIN